MTKFFGLLFALALGACATASFSTKSSASDARLANQHLYIYSMLDLRSSEFGTAMVGAVNERLVARLTEHGVASETLTYSEAIGNDKGPTQFQTVRIPLAQIIVDHQEQERAFGANYRLIIMPSSMTVGGAGQSYDVNWMLIEIPSNRVVWSTTLRGSRTIWWSQSEDANGRARTFVDGVIAQMESSGLFAPSPTQAPAPNSAT